MLEIYEFIVGIAPIIAAIAASVAAIAAIKLYLEFRKEIDSMRE